MGEGMFVSAFVCVSALLQDSLETPAEATESDPPIVATKHDKARAIAVLVRLQTKADVDGERRCRKFLKQEVNGVPMRGGVGERHAPEVEASTGGVDLRPIRLGISLPVPLVSKF